MDPCTQRKYDRSNIYLSDLIDLAWKVTAGRVAPARVELWDPLATVNGSVCWLVAARVELWDPLATANGSVCCGAPLGLSG